MEKVDQQHVPVRMWRQKDRLTIAAPMPGLEPADITVEVSADRRLTLHGDLRGFFKEGKDVLVNEWSVGCYHREIELPESVDAEMANVTFGNGVLVVALPIAASHRPAQLSLEQTGNARGQRVGHAGSEMAPHSTEAHRAAMEDQHRQVGDH